MRMVMFFVGQILHRPMASHGLAVWTEHRIQEWPRHILIMIFSKGFGTDVDGNFALAFLDVDAALLCLPWRRHDTTSVQQQNSGGNADSSPQGHVPNLSAMRKRGQWKMPRADPRPLGQWTKVGVAS